MSMGNPEKRKWSNSIYHAANSHGPCRLKTLLLLCLLYRLSIPLAISGWLICV